MRKYRNISIVVSLFLPALVFAAPLEGIKDLIKAVGGLINPLIRIAVGVALLAFFWGLVKFIFQLGGKEDAVKEGRKIMIWGLVALFVMVSVWGIIGFVEKALIPGGRFVPSGSGFPGLLNI